MDTASVRARLLALAQNKGEDYQRVLGRFAIERFLYRLGRSPHRDRFALKGATLFTLWTGQTHRPTKDLDLLGRGSSAIGEVEETIRAICEIQEDFMFIRSQARQLQNMVARYRAIPTLWTNLSAANTLGNTSRWVNGINSGTYSIAQQGYGQINRSLTDPTGVNTYDGLKRSYGLEELSDGSTINGMATIGDLRNHAQQLEMHIKQLEDDSLSSDSDLNTQVAVLNKINAASMLLVRTMQDTNKLLASLLEQQLVTTERNRRLQFQPGGRECAMRRAGVRSRAVAARLPRLAVCSCISHSCRSSINHSTAQPARRQRLRILRTSAWRYSKTRLKFDAKTKFSRGALAAPLVLPWPRPDTACKPRKDEMRGQYTSLFESS